MHLTTKDITRIQSALVAKELLNEGNFAEGAWDNSTASAYAAYCTKYEAMEHTAAHTQPSNEDMLPASLRTDATVEDDEDDGDEDDEAATLAEAARVQAEADEAARVAAEATAEAERVQAEAEEAARLEAERLAAEEAAKNDVPADAAPEAPVVEEEKASRKKK